MSQKLKRGYRKLGWQVLAVLAIALLLWGCGGGGGSSYDEPTSTQTATPLIEAATLMDWSKDGLVNDDGFENVRILQVGTSDEYNAGHVPGAYLWNSSSELVMASRLDGLAFEPTSTVPEGAILDAMLQRSGVDCDTTIVISYPSTKNIYYAARAYFTLRYWGFGKDKIKVLNGGNNGWTDAGYTLTTEATAEKPSDFSVRENGSLGADLHVSMGEMIAAVDANNASITASSEPQINIIQQTTGARVIANAIGRSYGYFAVGGVTTGGYFVTPTEALAALKDSDGPADNLTLGEFHEDLPSITHCVSGMSCTPIFFALDGLLGLDVAVFDGSAGEWNIYRGDAAGSDSYINDAWNVNLNGRSNDTSTVNANRATQIDPHLNFIYRTVTDSDANQIEKEDSEYMGSGTSDGPTSPNDVDPSGC